MQGFTYLVAAYAVVWAGLFVYLAVVMLRIRGVRTSRRRVLRLMRQHGLLAPLRAGSPRGPRDHDGTIIPDAVDTMWGTDMTTTVKHYTKSQRKSINAALETIEQMAMKPAEPEVIQ